MATFSLPSSLEPFSAPLKTFQTSYDPAARLVVGAFIFSYAHQIMPDARTAAQEADAESQMKPRLLLLHRASADAYGDLWDFPGGSCEESDGTLLDAVKREVWEETGLRVADVVEFIGLRTWEDSRQGRHRKWAKFSFTVTVAEAKSNVEKGITGPPEVKLAEEEHQAFRWATEEDIQASLEGADGALQFIAIGEIEVAAEAFKRLQGRVPDIRSGPRDIREDDKSEGA
jgi:8-oxo-dGTP pyrophosphatase MutT (NUDIX family)